MSALPYSTRVRITRLHPVLALALLATAASTTSLAAQDSSSPQVAAILAYEHAACDAYRRNDVRAIDSLIGPGYELTDSKGVITTKADDIKAARNRDVEYSAFRNEGMQVRIYGPTAIVTGRTLVQGTTKGGDKIDIEVQFTDTLVLLDGRWRMVAGHVSRLKS